MIMAGCFLKYWQSLYADMCSGCWPCLKITPFTGMTCVIITVICCLGSILYGIKCKNRITNSLPWEQTTLVYREEILFFWCFFSGHIWRDFIRRLMERKNIWILVLCSPWWEVQPYQQDMWFAGKSFNYYYGGQYLAVFLTKLTGTSVEITYNLMRLCRRFCLCSSL